MRLFIVIILLGIFLNTSVFAATRCYNEKVYQHFWCQEHKGLQEVVLPDRARVDCVTNEYAIEFDFADKWGESIGQALYYATILKKQAGIVLIMENVVKDEKYLNRVKAVAERFNIRLWTITPSHIMPLINISE